jgi:alanine racemase
MESIEEETINLNPLEHLELNKNELKNVQKILQKLELKLNLIMNKLGIKEEKKPIDLIELYGLKPLSFYENKN